MRGRTRAVVCSGLLVAAIAASGVEARPAPSAMEDRTGDRPPASRVGPYRGMPEARGEWHRLLWLDFGVPGNRIEGSIGIHPENPIAGSAWVKGIVRTAEAPGVRDPYLRDDARGTDAVYRLAVDPNDTYLASLTLGEGDSLAAPLSVWESGKPVAEGLVPPPGGFLDVTFPVRPGAEELAIRIRAEGCGTFALAGLALYRKGSVPPHPHFRWGAREGGEIPVRTPAIPDRPGVWDPPDGGDAAARTLLAAACDTLLAYRTSEGCFAASGSWYESSFPVRTLLAAGDVLGRGDARDAARECLDRFVADQEPGGNWSSGTFGRAGCAGVRAGSGADQSANLADVGSMVLALLAGARGAEPARRERYLEAARRYADAVVLPSQLESGAFPNLLFLGTEYRTPYSVATGIQGSVLAGLGAATGEAVYRTAAVRAARFLAAAVETTGEMRFYRHDRAPVTTIPSAALGDAYYVIEGLLSVLPVTTGEDRAGIEEALRRYFEGPRGLFASMERKDWWQGIDPWEAAKQAGTLFLIDRFARSRGDDAAASAWRGRTLAILAGPAPPFGVLADPAGIQGRLALVATGFAGLGAASVLDPRAVVPVATAGTR